MPKPTLLRVLAMTALASSVTFAPLSASPLLDALKKMDHAKIVAAFAAGASANERLDPLGTTPIFVAIEARDLDAMKLLVERGADVNASTSAEALSQAPLHVAAGQGYIEGVKFLLDHGARIEQLNLFSYTPLAMAAAFGRVEALSLLIERGAALDSRNISGNTPLAVAAAAGHAGAVRALVAAGASETIKNNNGQTVYDVAFAAADLSPDTKAGILAALQERRSPGTTAAPAPVCTDIAPIAKRLAATNPRASPQVLMEALRQYQVLRGCIAPPQKAECSWVAGTWTCITR